jgi:hypothetical protein
MREFKFSRRGHSLYLLALLIIMCPSTVVRIDNNARDRSSEARLFFDSISRNLSDLLRKTLGLTTSRESLTSALPNLFDEVIFAELKTGEATVESVSSALASTELFHKAVRTGIDEARARQYDVYSLIANFICTRIGTTFFALAINMTFS